MEEKIQSFTDLRAWQQGHQLVLLVYELTERFPQKEIFGLTSQMRRSAVSITSNIAEGFSRNTPREKYQFYCIAHGSLTELQNQFIIARDVGYIRESDYSKAEEQMTVVGKILSGLKRIKNSA